MNLHDPMILRQIIMDHYQYPRNKHECEHEACRTVHMATESCIDDIYVHAIIKDGAIQDVSFHGVACTISTASTSIMTELLKHKTLAEAKTIIAEYEKMIDLQPYDEALLQEAVAFSNIGKQANRIRCATLGWDGIKQLILESELKND